MLSCENITCIRGDKRLFGNLGFCLAEGALLLLKGPNGSGKTSLLKILAGLLEPDSGQVLWNGEPIAHNGRFRRDLMLIGHKSAVKLECTVHENLSFWAKLYGTEMLVPAALAFYDLGIFRDTRAGELSAGWRRRVALARLVVAPCRLWLLDEPTNFLDDAAVTLTASLIESRVQQGGIVVAASHIMNSAIAAHTLFLGDFCNPAGREAAAQDLYPMAQDTAPCLRLAQD
ncbi:MAG: heme ABC exporter ATP-binding protein CcmA [Pseudomonadota bacterium]|nr:heme ABC exporter ATP-binding protein CcmA [Pseudomonadota bacterium]MDE3038135.1 heme ABC exporter ATP-binding protein CcmA [Pseudomonadota bacterium]